MKWLIPLVLLLASFASAQTTCTNNNGTDCPEWVHKLIGQYPPSPYIALPTRQEAAGFWTMRSFNDAPLRTNKQILKSKSFWGLNSAFAAVVIYDVRHTHGVRESAGSEYPVIPAVIALDYLMDRFVSRSLSVEAPVYGIIHYTRDALK